MKHVTIHLLFAPMVLAFQQTHLIMIHRSQATTRNSYGWRCCSLRQFRWSLTMSADTERKTLAPGSHMAEMEVKKSRFLGYAKHVESWDEAQQYIEDVKSEHPKGRHWCYGFRCGVNPVQERCSDDGEPTGTAGLPILGK